MIIPTLISTIVVSLLSLIGIFTFSLKTNFLKKILIILVSLSAGALLGGAFFHLIPEALENQDSLTTMIYVIIGFLIFFLMEKILYWRHCHDSDCKIHSFAYINLFGDGIHNFIDGLIIAASFSSSISLGISTTLAVILHEIPQEIGDFGVLLHSGIKKRKALFFNFLTAITAIVGGLVGSIFTTNITLLNILISIAAGGFIYISSSDLIPEIHKEKNVKKWTISFVTFVIGLTLMFGFCFLE